MKRPQGGGEGFLLEGTAGAKALRLETVWCVRGAAEKPLWLEGE